MPRIGIIVGSASSKSINRAVAATFPSLVQGEDVEFVPISIADLPIYSPDYDGAYPAAALEWKQSIEDVDGIIILTPEYLRSVPGVLKNALEWAARPWGTNSFAGKPVAVMGVSVGAIGTAAAQQHLRAILGHLDTLTMGQPETFLQYRPTSFSADGEIIDDSTRAVLTQFVEAAVAHVSRHALVTA